MPYYTLLLADESSATRRVVEMGCVDEDIMIVAVRDGHEAIERIPLERPDIIVADIRLPTRNGYEVSSFVKGRPDLAHIPVILLAGALETLDEALVEQSLCDSVLRKPFEPLQLLAQMRELLEAATGPDAPAEPAGAGAPSSSAAIPEASAPPEPSRDVPGTDPKEIDAYLAQLTAAFADLNARRVQEAPPVRDRRDADDDATGDDEGVAVFDLPGGEPGREAEVADEPITVDAASVPTLEELLGEIGRDEVPDAPFSLDEPFYAFPPPGPAAPRPPVPTAILEDEPARPAAEADAEAPPPAPTATVAEAFTALLAVEQGEPGAVPVRLVSPLMESMLTDILVERVTQRVLERLEAVIGTRAEATAAAIAAEVAARLRDADPAGG